MNSLNSSERQHKLGKTLLSCPMKSFAIISLLFILNSCALQTERKSRYAGRSYEKIFQAAVQAVHDINFLVVTNNFKSGMIVAEKSFSDNEGNIVAHRLIVSVKSSSSGVRVMITSKSEFTGIKNDKKPLKEFVKALKKRTPAYLNVTSY